jgi:hypothetical protein
MRKFTIYRRVFGIHLTLDNIVIDIQMVGTLFDKYPQEVH